MTKLALFIHALFFATVFSLLAAVTMIPGAAYAALPIYEPFADATANSGTSYTVGAAVPGQSNAATGSGAHWFAAGTTVGAPTPANNTIATGNLSVSGLAALSGNMMEYGVSAGPSARLNLDTTYTSGTLYYSFALKVTDLGSLGTSGGFSVGFNNAQGDQTGTPSVVSTVMMLRSVVSASSGNFNIGVRKGTGTPDWSPTVFSITDPNPIFVIGSYTFNTGSTTDDVSKMWLNPSSSTFGSATPPADQLVHTGVADINSPGIASLVFFRRVTTTNQPADMFSDEIRVGTTWADVTPAAATPNLFGDFNSDSKVDAGDYVTWRKNEVANSALPNDNGVGNQTDRFTLWRANFGNPPSGGGLEAANVPEPGTLAGMLALAAAGVLRLRPRRKG